MRPSADPLGDVEYAAAFEFLRYIVRLQASEYDSITAYAERLMAVRGMCV